MRRFRPEDTFFLICRAGSQIRIWRPPCSVGRANKSGAAKVVPRQHNRPPKHCRAGLSHGGPFVSVVVKRAVQNCLARPSVEPAPQPRSKYLVILRRSTAWPCVVSWQGSAGLAHVTFMICSMFPCWFLGLAVNMHVLIGGCLKRNGR